MEQHIIVQTSGTDCIRYFGPVSSFSEAYEWAKINLPVGTWKIEPLMPAFRADKFPK